MDTRDIYLNPQGVQNQFGLSPYAQQAMPYDMRFLHNEYSGTFSPPGGMNSNNPLINLTASAIMQSVTGSSYIRPLQGYSGPDYSYIQGMQRYQLSREARANLINSAPGLRAFAGSLPIDDTLLQNFYSSTVAGGGDPTQAWERAMSTLGTKLGGSLREQGAASQEMIRQIRDGFSDRNTGTYNFRKSFGQDLNQTVENIKTLQDIGIQSVSEDLAKSSKSTERLNLDGTHTTIYKDPSRFQSLATNADKLVRLGKQTLGEDMPVQEMMGLLDKAAGGLSGISAEKATDFLSKIQAASRAIGISGQAMTEYVKMQNQIYKSVGQDGIASGNAIINAMEMSRIGSDANKGKFGSTILADSSVYLEAKSKNDLDYMTSSVSKANMLAENAFQQMSKGEADKTMLTVEGNQMSFSDARAELAGGVKTQKRAQALALAFERAGIVTPDMVSSATPEEMRQARSTNAGLSDTTAGSD